MRSLNIIVEDWPITGTFRIARGHKTHARTLVVNLNDNDHTGRGECVPYARYGESVDSVSAQIETIRRALENGLNRQDLQQALPAGAARNALDCALWDLDAKMRGEPVWKLAGLAQPKPVQTALTITIDQPQIMAQKAQTASSFPVLKLKLAGDGSDLERLSAIHKARPDARLILDANEGLTPGQLKALLPDLERLSVVLIEQPLPVSDDHHLADLASPIPLCADESLHTSADLDRLSALYGAVNIKLDKTGGLSEAIQLAQEAKARGLTIMLGCMVGTSLGMAPSLLLGDMADFIDLDGPLLLQGDRTPGLVYDEAWVHTPAPDLWG